MSRQIKADAFLLHELHVGHKKEMLEVVCTTVVQG